MLQNDQYKLYKTIYFQEIFLYVYLENSTSAYESLYILGSIDLLKTIKFI